MSSSETVDDNLDIEYPEHYQLEGIYDDEEEQKNFTIFDPDADSMTNWITASSETTVLLGEKR